MFAMALSARRLVLAVGLLCMASSVSAAFISLDPRATYLRVNEHGWPFPATAYSLSGLGLSAGEEIYVQRSGDYRTSHGSLATDTATSLLAVFSSTSELLEMSLEGTGLDWVNTSVLHRVPGAIATEKPQRVSLPTAIGSFATDITEDFNVSSSTNPIKVKIPIGAAFIFFSPNDDTFWNNTDPDGDFGVNIWAVNPKPVPLPDSLLLAGSAFVLLGASRRIKR